MKTVNIPGSRGTKSRHFQRRFAGLLVLFMLVFSGSLHSQPAKITFSELAQEAHLIFTGTAGQTTCTFNIENNMIFSEVVFKDIEVISSREASKQKDQNEILIKYPGGQIGDQSISVSGAPKFAAGRRYLLFVYDDGNIYINPVIGEHQGLFEVMNDEITGLPYIMNCGSKALLMLSTNELLCSHKKVLSINNGNTIYDTRPTESEFDRVNPALASGDTVSSSTQSDLDINDHLPPVSLAQFTAFIVDSALKCPVKQKILRKSDETGHFYKKTGEQIEAEDLKLSTPTIKILNEESVPDSIAHTVPLLDEQNIQMLFDNIPASESKGGQLGACGYHSLSLVMQQVPTSWWSYSINNDCMWTWNQFMSIYQYTASDGSFGNNSQNEFCGWVSNATLQSVYGFNWGSGLAMCISWNNGGCSEITQSDVCWNAAYSWTSDFSYSLGNSAVLLLRPIAMHELGHTWGEQCGTYTETYDYDVPTVMHSYYSYLVENGQGIHKSDAYLIRRIYDNQISIPSYRDLGVESYYASNGLHNSTTNSSYYYPGQSITINNFTVENSSYTAQSSVKVRFYLSSNNVISTGDYQLGLFNNAEWTWTSFAAEAYSLSNYTSTVPLNVPAGQYYVGAIVTYGGYSSDGYSLNNSTFLYSKITVNNAIKVSGTIAESNGNPVAGVTVNFSFGGSATTDALGYYIATVPYNWTGSITPIFQGWQFSPVSRSLSNVTSNQYNQNFVAIPPFCQGTSLLTAYSDYFNDGSGSADYFNRSKCKWLISPPGAYSIALTFSAFDTEAGYDFVKVYDGTDTLSPLLGSFSGASPNIPVLYSTGGNMLVCFYTDGSVVGHGFDANYVTCGAFRDSLITNILYNDLAYIYQYPSGGWYSGHNGDYDIAFSDKFTNMSSFDTIKGGYFYFYDRLYSSVNSVITACIWDDSGPNGTPGNILASTDVPIVQLLSGFTYIPFTPTIYTGSIYMGYQVHYQQGDTVCLVLTDDRPQGVNTAWVQHSDSSWVAYSDPNYAGVNFSHYIYLYKNATILPPIEVNIADITADYCIGDTVTYNAGTFGTATYFYWHFGDGASPQTSNQQGPITVVYSTSGTKSVVLYSDGLCGYDMDTLLVDISHESIGGNVSGGALVCASSPIPVLTLTGNYGNVIKWQKRLLPGSWTDITWTDTTFSETVSAPGTWEYRAVVQNATCDYAFSGTDTVQADPVSDSGTITGAHDICFGNPTDTLKLVNYTGNIVKWQKRYNFGMWADISNTSDLYFETPPLTGIWEYRAEVVSSICPSAFSVPVTINVSSANFNLAFNQNQQIFTQPPFLVYFWNTTSSPSDYNFWWDFGDSGTSTLESPTHTYTWDGQYTITLVGENKVTGCLDTLIRPHWIICSGSGGIENASANAAVSIFPNPTKDKVNLKFDQSGDVNYNCRLFNVLGMKVYEMQINGDASSAFEIDMSNLRKGSYLLKMESEANTFHFKIIKY